MRQTCVLAFTLNLAVRSLFRGRGRPNVFSLLSLLDCGTGIVDSKTYYARKSLFLLCRILYTYTVFISLCNRVLPDTLSQKSKENPTC